MFPVSKKPASPSGLFRLVEEIFLDRRQVRFEQDPAPCSAIEALISRDWLVEGNFFRGEIAPILSIFAGKKAL